MTRQSNFELLRIVAMAMVLVLHANYLSFGRPSIEEFHEHFMFASSRTLIEQICIPAVDIFVFISGWFGMRLTVRGFLSILFQSMFYCLLIILIFCSFVDCIDVSTIIKQLYFGSSYWFVVAYLGLMVISPVLNSFIEHASRNQVRNTLMAFFSFQTIYGWLFLDFGGFADGYSILSFAGMYSLARYLRLFNEEEIRSRSKPYYLLVFAILVLASVLIQVFCSALGNDLLFVQCQDKFMAYTNPLVIMCAVTVALFFSKINIQSKIINWLASSCFAIYLVHANPLTLPKYEQFISRIYESESSALGLVLIALTIFIIALISIFIDRIRLSLWNRVQKSAFNG